jgi:VanZ family protein
MALLDEGHQSLLASRSGSLRDVGLDLAGSSGAALILTIFRTPGAEAESVTEA